ncbi:GNAT family N-acetyltransferase [Marinoscillum furvescens]|uniref:Ribosomal protein S18 acetylase RimI-like enzyme n=1 Tax=Marinoscillum furvescens DSM 4134 TaxID=1122208 RepID=A0A3D9L2I8_MARFU|nr:GNAT family N-acetyltransferase [Marinoscillum furvescens]RED98825.1 ribosomal protein S18 acetylase RimI-like enzyme [Marinoscillum furvescens DSM 4134]
MALQIAAFEEEDWMSLYEAFLSAFSNYFVRFAPSKEDFEKRIFHKLYIDGPLSRLAWEDGQVAGFLLHTHGPYRGKSTLYNGGTGVVPAFQRQNIATRLYENLLHHLSAAPAIQQIVLEVVDQNQAGLKFYEQLDFKYTQSFKCFKLTTPVEERLLEGINFHTPSNWASYDELFSIQPAFLDTSDHLTHNKANEHIIEATHNDQVVGAVIFQPHLGRISQLVVDEAWRARGIGRQLCARAQKVSKGKPLTLMNVTEDAYDTIEALEAIGFVNEVNQFELELII